MSHVCDIQVDDVLAEGDLVAARWSGEGTHRGDGLGFTATSKRAQFKGLVIVRVRDGKLSKAGTALTS